MSKKIIFGTILLVSLLFTFNMCFATDLNTMKEDTKSMVDDAKNTTENITSPIREKSEELDNAVDNSMNTMENNYTATRTSTTSTDNMTFMGMGSTAWTWLIFGILGIGIVAIVLYYASEIKTPKHQD